LTNLVAGTTFSRVNFGTAISSNPALRAIGTDLFVRLADDSGNTNLTAFDVTPSSSQITSGSGTGITVNSSGLVRDTVYKVTIASTAFVCNAVTCDVTIGTLPAKTWLKMAFADLTV